MKQFSLFVGIDVSKLWLDIAVRSEHNIIVQTRIDNTSKDIMLFLKQLKKQLNMDPGSTLFCLEQTGKYGNPFLQAACLSKLNVWLELPLQIKRSQGMTRGKSDKLDAKRIAEYAYRFFDKVTLWKPTDKLIEQLKELQSKRSQLVKVIQQLTQEAKIDPVMKKPIVALKAAVEAIEKKMEVVLNADQQCRQQFELLKSIPGIGKQTAIALIVATQNFTRITDKRKLSCYAGLAPFPYSSGSSVKGKNRVSKLGNLKLKTLLNLSAWNAIRSIPSLKSYYEKKVAQGKHKLCVINAIRNKLLAIALSVIKRNTPFEKDFTIVA